MEIGEIFWESLFSGKFKNLILKKKSTRFMEKPIIS
jgi:hypothetical protein